MARHWDWGGERGPAETTRGLISLDKVSTVGLGLSQWAISRGTRDKYMGSICRKAFGATCQGLLLALAMLCWCGCAQEEFRREPVPPVDPGQLLKPVSIKIHHSSAVVLKSEDGEFDSLSVVCEVKDRFGDPVKTLGEVRFEAYAYACSQPENKGSRVGFWPNVNIDSLEAIQRHWDGIWGLYRFNLKWKREISSGERFVLEVTLITAEGEQLTDSQVLQASP